MKKQKYSLTASQRKNIRNKANDKQEKNRPADFEGNGDVSAETDAVAVVPKKFNWWLIPLLGAGIALIVIAIVLPFSCGEYRFIDNPVAKIELSTGDVLEFELYEDTCPIAATNFIFLARNKFFDNTIVFDNQQGWVRFGNYKSMTEYVSQDKEYCEKLPGFSEGHKDNKLGYRLRSDSSDDAKRYMEEGMLVFNYNQSSNEFFISSDKNLQTRLDNINYEPTVVGRYLNDKTLAAVKRIANMESNPSSPHSRWRNPIPVVVIKKVSIYNVDKAKWKDFGFEKYMETAYNGSSAISGWHAS
ncbi:MAG: hypothetical protein HFE48_04915 [Clostridia bacterium]|nr:hypothetical protein [Clostridia bacterium]